MSAQDEMNSATVPGGLPGHTATPTFSRKPVLVGERVTLRPANGDDAARLGELMQDPDIDMFTGSTNSSSTAAPAHAPDDLRRIYSEWAKADDRIAWVVIDHRDQAIVGEVVLNHLDSGSRWCSFRIWLSRREQGLGSEATLLALGHAFDGAGLNRVELEVFDFNHRARAVYEKAGFTLEGIRRQALLFDGNWIDSHVMSILRSEWLVNTGSE